MRSQIPFVDELRRELLESAPVVLEREAPVRRRRRFSGPVVALAAFLLVLAGGGTALWLAALRGTAPAVVEPDFIAWDLQVWLGSPPDDPQSVINEIEAMPEVVETQYFPDAAELHPETSADLGFAALLVRLADGVDPEAVGIALSQRDGVTGISYSPALAARLELAFYDRVQEGATVISEDPLILQPLPGPEPGFDTSSLGEEIELEKVPPDATMLDTLQRGSLSYLRGDSSRQRDETRPILNIGRVTAPSFIGYSIPMQLVLYPTTNGGFCEVELQGEGSGTSCGFFSDIPFGVFGSSSGEGSFLTVAVPLGTSIVTLETEADGTMWQRPTAGWALFPTSSRDPGMAGIVDAYDQAGNLIGHWESSY